MKKTAYYYLSLAAIVAGGLVSCQDENQGFTQDEISYAATQRDYTKNFIAKYGEIDPNHTWGFDSPATRAGEQKEYGYYKINRTRIAKNDVQGFESVGGVQMTSEHFPNFKATLPPEVTKEEAEYVCKYIYNHPEEGYTTELFTTYYMQAVAKVQHTYIDPQNGENVIGCEKMQKLYVDQQHNNDFNSDNCGWKFVPTIEENAEGKMVWTSTLQSTNCTYLEALIVRSATTSPNYLDAYSSHEHVENHYKYYDIEYNGVVGTYLAFDYASLGFSDGLKTIAADGHYDDWVVKITDAHRATCERVFCEDLGSIHDWDFNDLVFDYTIESGWVYIDVLAFSGTLPLGSDFADDGVLIESHEPVGAESGHAFLPKEAPILASYKFASDYTDIQDFAFWAVHNSTTQWESGKDNHDIPVDARWVIRNQSGCAPYMIQVPTTVDWPDEEQEIGDKYPKFKTWVGNNGNGQAEWWK